MKFMLFLFTYTNLHAMKDQIMRPLFPERNLLLYTIMKLYHSDFIQ